LSLDEVLLQLVHEPLELGDRNVLRVEVVRVLLEKLGADQRRVVIPVD
jgi:hypothetical protein